MNRFFAIGYMLAPCKSYQRSFSVNLLENIIDEADALPRIKQRHSAVKQLD